MAKQLSTAETPSYIFADQVFSRSYVVRHIRLRSFTVYVNYHYHNHHRYHYRYRYRYLYFQGD